MSFLAPNERIPGVYQEHRLQRQAGGLQLSSRVLLIGMRTDAAGDAHDLEAIPIRTRADSQAAFGAGSPLDLMVRAALATGELARLDTVRGGTPELHAMALAPLAGAGTAVATQTVTFDGVAGNQGQVQVLVNDHAFSFGVLRDEDGTAAAARLETAMAARSAETGYTVTSAGDVVTFTARAPGAWGDELVLAIDTTRIAGLSATVARGTSGAGNLDLTAALKASLAVDYDCVVVSESDPATRALVKAHIANAWDYTRQRYRLVVLGTTEPLAAARAAASALDDFRVVLASAEKVPGAASPFERKHSSRAHGFELAASVGARLYTQRRPNSNYNDATLPVVGRPRTLDRVEVNDAIAAGLTMVLAGEKSPGQIVDPIATTVTDPMTGTPSTEWQPIEVARTIQAITRSIQAELALFPRADSDTTALETARAAALAVLETAAGARYIRPVANDDVIASYEIEGAVTQLVLAVNYAVITGLDRVAVTHNITR